jgi:hypothetical protein
VHDRQGQGTASVWPAQLPPSPVVGTRLKSVGEELRSRTYWLGLALARSAARRRRRPARARARAAGGAAPAAAAAREDYCALRLLDSPWELSSEPGRQVRSHHERCWRPGSLLNSGKWGLGDR